MTERPGWMGKLPGVDVMTSDEAKAYVQHWNRQDLAHINVSSPDWIKFAAFISEAENQAALSSFALISKDIIQLAKVTLSSSSYFVTVKSLQVGLRDPDYVDKLKKDMLNGNFNFSEPTGKIARYIDSKGQYYVTDGNHRMVAAQDIFKQTGDGKYIEQLLKNGVWTQTKTVPPDAVPLPKR